MQENRWYGALRLQAEPGQVVITSTPGCFWLFGLFWLTIGGIASAAALTAQQNPGLGLLFVGGPGVVALFIGLWFLGRPVTRCQFDLPAGTLRWEQWRWFWCLRREDRALADLASIDLDDQKDNDGDPIYQLRLVFHIGEPLPLQCDANHDQPNQMALRAALAERLGINLPTDETA